MYTKFTAIDDLTLGDHSFLSPDDSCYFLGEYTARGGYAASRTNQLIFNLKKKMDQRNRGGWQYKAQAISTIADDLRRIMGREAIESLTFVPVPPSKATSDPLYDDRLTQILRRMGAGFNADTREIVRQRASMAASHATENRASIQELVENYEIDENLVGPPRQNVFVIFDDMLTTGRHFKAMQAVLSARFAGVDCIGLFVARRIPNTTDIEDLFGPD